MTTRDRPLILPSEIDVKKKRKGMISVSPKYAEQHPESVTKIGDFFYRPAVSAKETQAYRAAGLTTPEVHAKKLTPEGQFELAKVTGEVPKEGIFVPGEGEEWGFTTPKEQRLGEMTELERIKAEASGVLPTEISGVELHREAAVGMPKAQQPPRGVSEVAWGKYVLSYFGGSEERVKQWRESGQSLATYGRGTRYGEGTAQVLGLQPHIAYDTEKLKPWFDKLKAYRLFNEQNLDKLKRFPNWVRGAQLGLSPEAYLKIAEELDITSRELTGIELYLFGQTDEAPEGFMSIPSGAPLKYQPQVEPVQRQTAEEWFAETYPSIAAERGGARSTQRGWRDIFTGTSRFAPKIKTLTF